MTFTSQLISNTYEYFANKRVIHIFVKKRRQHVQHWTVVVKVKLLSTLIVITKFKISEVVYTSLYQPGNFIIISLSSKHYLTIEINISESTIINSEEECMLMTSQSIMKIAGGEQNIFYELKYKPIALNYVVDEFDAMYGV